MAYQPPNPKPAKGSLKRQKAKAARAESKVVKATRALTVLRDGYCLVASRLPASISVLLGPCAGPSEWAHIGRLRRCFTRGLPPEVRHTTVGSGQMCQRHHAMYDLHEFDITTDAHAGMDGAIAIVRRKAA